MLQYSLRKQGMRDLGSAAAVPVAVLPVLVANVVRYQVLSRSRVGRRYLEWWGERSRRQLLQRFFGDAAHDIGELRFYDRRRTLALLLFRVGALEGTVHRRRRITHMT